MRQTPRRRRPRRPLRPRPSPRLRPPRPSPIRSGRQVVVPDPITNVWCTSPAWAQTPCTRWRLTCSSAGTSPPPRWRRNSSPNSTGRHRPGRLYARTQRQRGGDHQKGLDAVLDLGDLDEAISRSSASRVCSTSPCSRTMLIDRASALRHIGDLLGVQERAEELAAYCDDALGEASEVAASPRPTRCASTTPRHGRPQHRSRGLHVIPRCSS